MSSESYLRSCSDAKKGVKAVVVEVEGGMVHQNRVTHEVCSAEYNSACPLTWRV
jgi:hypothetical protein